MNFVTRYKKADTLREKIMCYIVKILHAHYVTPLGRVILLPVDYDQMEKEWLE